MNNFQEEIWRPVIGYEGWYEISSIGRLKSLRFRPGGKVIFREKMLNSRAINTSGYCVAILVKDEIHQTVMIHRLVAQSFLPPPDNPAKRFVNHKDGDKLNNRDGNLEWVTASENVRHSLDIGLSLKHSGCAKLTESNIAQIRTLIAGGLSNADIASRFNVSAGAIYHIKSGKNWSTVQ